MHKKIQHGIHTVLNRKRIEMERRIVKSKQIFFIIKIIDKIFIFNKGILITTGGFIFTWTPYAITLFVSAFQGKDYAIPPLVTFYCACFAKSSVIWIPLLYISTSTQFRFSFVNLQATNEQRESNQGDEKTPRKLDIVCHDDGSVVIRAVHSLGEKRVFSSANTHTCSI